MQDWDDDGDDWDEDDWSSASSGPSRIGLVVVAVVLLVPFVMTFAGGANAVDALGPGLIAVIVFFVAVALALALVRRWLRRRLVPERTVWSDRR